MAIARLTLTDEAEVMVMVMNQIDGSTIMHTMTAQEFAETYGRGGLVMLERYLGLSNRTPSIMYKARRLRRTITAVIPRFARGG